MGYDYSYMTDGADCNSEMRNTLIVIDASVGNLKIEHKPQFHVVGGCALIFHGLRYEVTLDIDTANKLDARVRDYIDGLISDDASNVATLAKDYESRLVPFMQKELKHIEVYIVSKEDLAISKFGSGRKKDIFDVLDTGLYDICDKVLLKSIMEKMTEEQLKSIKFGIKFFKQLQQTR